MLYQAIEHKMVHEIWLQLCENYTWKNIRNYIEIEINVEKWNFVKLLNNLKTKFGNLNTIT